MKVWWFLFVFKVCYAFSGKFANNGKNFKDLFVNMEGSGGNDDACYVGYTNCHCCLMMNKVNNLSSSTNQKLDSLESDLKRTTQLYTKLQSKRSAFSAALFPTPNNLYCLELQTTEATLRFKKVFFNMGSDYDNETGIYTAPYDGYYMVSITVFHDAGTPSNDLFCILVYKNTDVIAGSSDNSVFDHEDSATMSTAVLLHAGDMVRVARKGGCVICARNGHYNVFSVFLLYAE